MADLCRNINSLGFELELGAVIRKYLTQLCC